MNQVVDKALRGMTLLQVRNIRHWTDKTFSFNCARPESFRFRSGEFVMIGLMAEGKPPVYTTFCCGRFGWPWSSNGVRMTRLCPSYGYNLNRFQHRGRP
jgi:hypothetical protein